MTCDTGRIEVTGASVPTLLAGLLQRYAILAGTADIVLKRLQSVQNTAARSVSRTIFRDIYNNSTQPPLASGVEKYRLSISISRYFEIPLPNTKPTFKEYRKNTRKPILTSNTDTDAYYCTLLLEFLRFMSRIQT